MRAAAMNQRNHKEWARDFEGTSPKLFPTLVMHEAPPAVALDGPSKSHVYLRLNR